MYLSILIPIYDERDNINPLYDQLTKVLDGLARDYEVIFVNDGSADGSDKILDDLAAKNPNARVIHMRRNFGQTAAIMAAIRCAKGDVMIPMDGDLQNDPVDIPRLLAKLDEGFDVVSGWRKNREDKALTRLLPSIIANGLISRVMGVRLHDYGCTMKAYRREVIEDVRLYGEMHRFIPIYAAWEGARVTEIPVTHHARKHGVSKYGLGRISRVLLDILVLYFIDRSFDRPIQFFGKIGLLSLSLSLIAFIWALIMKIFYATDFIFTPLPLLAGTLGIAGVMFMLLGVIAEMQSRTYYESQGRTTYSIKATRNIDPDDKEA
ncbi:MAG: glycosyl transferase [Rhodospirillales bacterium RIFCSPLOWO2_12_FULL_58_28]|nr:MAG: glycosyl transferase [Rhodospirillales bacterium RIFCSPLOWO2_02_FULL_58_16]OHC78374.1 MAG: glycosyl transferase [Rhodospirillales bacterium RIFCSPLOWO2_12_FULL_58_28]